MEWIFLALLCLLAAVGYLIVPLPSTAGLRSHPRPAGDYAEALRRIEFLQEQEPAGRNPKARLFFLTHGKRVDRVIVFFHGYTNCSWQFVELGRRFYRLGYNLLIVTMPRHGLADRMTAELEHLTAEELTVYADEMTDIARGLGERVVVAGLSGGGVLAVWLAMLREDVDLAMLMAPAFGLKPIPLALTDPAINLFLRIPNFYLWFSADKKIRGTPEHTYPRYSTRALAQILRLGACVRSCARRNPPAARSLIVVTNANDQSVSNAMTARVAEDWRRRGAFLTTFEFDKSLQLDHDFIDPEQPAQRIEIVYPELIELVTGNPLWQGR